jgi:ATP synthase F1 complex assembly factor 1
MFLLQRMVKERSNLKKKLSLQQQQTLKNFSSLSRNDYVYVDKNATVADVYSTVLDRVKDKALDDFMTKGAEETRQVFLSKYKDQLAKAAAKKGYESADALLLAQQQQEQSTRKEAEVKQEKIALLKKLPSKKDNSNLPSYVEKLDDIVKVEKLKCLEYDAIEVVWNKFHAAKDCISACLPKDIYATLYEKSKQFPMVLYY